MMKKKRGVRNHGKEKLKKDQDNKLGWSHDYVKERKVGIGYSK